MQNINFSTPTVLRCLWPTHAYNRFRISFVISRLPTYKDYSLKDRTHRNHLHVKMLTWEFIYRYVQALSRYDVSEWRHDCRDLSCDLPPYHSPHGISNLSCGTLVVCCLHYLMWSSFLRRALFAALLMRYIRDLSKSTWMSFVFFVFWSVFVEDVLVKFLLW